jgi:hypothetical protein
LTGSPLSRSHTTISRRQKIFPDRVPSAHGPANPQHAIFAAEPRLGPCTRPGDEAHPGNPLTSGHLAVSKVPSEGSQRQIDPIYMPQLMSAKGSLAAPNGGRRAVINRALRS